MFIMLWSISGLLVLLILLYMWRGFFSMCSRWKMVLMAAGSMMLGPYTLVCAAVFLLWMMYKNNEGHYY